MNKKGISVWLISVFLGTTVAFYSCERDEQYPIEPVIEYLDFVKFGTDSASFRITFTDGDGDVGLAPEDTFYPYNTASKYYHNIFLKYEFLDTSGSYFPYYIYEYDTLGNKIDSSELSFNYRIPVIPKLGAINSLNGEIHVKMFAPYAPFDFILILSLLNRKDMEKFYQKLLDGNRDWVAEKLKLDPQYFVKLSQGQAPPLLWIGCADSRVPANEITNTQPGEVFVHRNIANVVDHTDINLLSVVDYAVQILSVKHIVVCGHYKCGGIQAALGNVHYGLIDNWLRNIKDIYRLYQKELDAISDPHKREDRLVELNVIEGVFNICKTSTVQSAWENGKTFQLNGKRRREFLYIHFFCWKSNDFWRRFNAKSKPISKFWLDLGGYTPNQKDLLATNRLSRMFRFAVRFTNLVIRAKKRLLF